MRKINNSFITLLTFICVTVCIFSVPASNASAGTDSVYGAPESLGSYMVVSGTGPLGQALYDAPASGIYEYKAISTVYNGDLAFVISSQDGWLYVFCEGIYGWIPGTALEYNPALSSESNAGSANDTVQSSTPIYNSPDRELTFTDIPSEFAARTISYSNGDITYIPDDNSIVYGQDGSVIYSDVIDVYLYDAPTAGFTKYLAELAGGKVVGWISGIMNSVQIHVDPAAYTQDSSLTQLLMKAEGVLYALYEYPVNAEPAVSKDNLNNPFTDPSTGMEEPLLLRGTESSPYGNDDAWEAIQAYSAWEAALPQKTVKVGLLDNGVQTDHEELAGKIYHLKEPFNVDTPVETQTHGTNSASLIAAADNDTGIRGVSDTSLIYSVDIYNGDLELSHVTDITNNQLREIIKQLIEADVRIICIESAFAVYEKGVCQYWLETDSEDYAEDVKIMKKMREEYWWNKIPNIFDAREVIQSFTNSTIAERYAALKEKRQKWGAAQTGFEILAISAELIRNHEDFLIIHAAGNGLNWDDTTKSLDAAETGGFAASADRTAYDTLSQHFPESVRGVTYEEIKSHLLVVSGTHLDTYEDGSYRRDETNNGETVDICAPSEHVLSAACTDLSVKNNYSYFAGTSSAAPLVTGAAALIWSVDPDLTLPQVRDCLINGTTKRSVKEDDNKNITENYPMLNVIDSLTYARDVYGAQIADGQRRNDLDENVNIGDWVTFGNYNGNTDWIVLDKKEDKVLLLSRFAIEERSYDATLADEVTWETSYLRKWLNDTYYNITFSEEEKLKISATEVVNNDNEKYGTDGGNNTVDNIFLLSTDEMLEYFSFNTDCITALYNERSDNNGKAVSWWLRTPGADHSRAAGVNDNGFVSEDFADIKYTMPGVRPAMWVSIKEADTYMHNISGCYECYSQTAGGINSLWIQQTDGEPEAVVKIYPFDYGHYSCLTCQAVFDQGVWKISPTEDNSIPSEIRFTASDGTITVYPASYVITWGDQYTVYIDGIYEMTHPADPITQEMLDKVAADLNVPEDMARTYVVGTPDYYNARLSWECPVGITTAQGGSAFAYYDVVSGSLRNPRGYSENASDDGS